MIVWRQSGWLLNVMPCVLKSGIGSWFCDVIYAMHFWYMYRTQRKARGLLAWCILGKTKEEFPKDIVNLSVGQLSEYRGSGFGTYPESLCCTGVEIIALEFKSETVFSRQSDTNAGVNLLWTRNKDSTPTCSSFMLLLTNAPVLELSTVSLSHYEPSFSTNG